MAFLTCLSLKFSVWVSQATLAHSHIARHEANAMGSAKILLWTPIQTHLKYHQISNCHQNNDSTSHHPALQTTSTRLGKGCGCTGALGPPWDPLGPPGTLWHAMKRRVNNLASSTAKKTRRWQEDDDDEAGSKIGGRSANNTCKYVQMWQFEDLFEFLLWPLWTETQK